jgi:hypothetical protein
LAGQLPKLHTLPLQEPSVEPAASPATQAFPVLHQPQFGAALQVAHWLKVSHDTQEQLPHEEPSPLQACAPEPPSQVHGSVEPGEQVEPPSCIDSAPPSVVPASLPAFGQPAHVPHAVPAPLHVVVPVPPCGQTQDSVDSGTQIMAPQPTQTAAPPSAPGQVAVPRPPSPHAQDPTTQSSHPASERHPPPSIAGPPASLEGPPSREEPASLLEPPSSNGPPSPAGTQESALGTKPGSQAHTGASFTRTHVPASEHDTSRHGEAFGG